MTTSRVGSPGTAPRAALWLLLGGWAGAWACFGLLVAPTAFSVLPSTALAGSLVGPILAGLHLYGGAAGIGLAALAHPLHRGSAFVALPLGLAALCLYSHFGVTAEIAEARELTFGSAGNPEMAARWQALHRISVGIFSFVGAGVLLLLALHARADARELATRNHPPGREKGVENP